LKYKAPFCVGTMGAGQLRQPVLMAAAAGKPYNRSSSVGRFIGRSFCVQAKDKLRPTWRPSAGSPQQKCTLLVPLCNEQLKLTQGESIEQTSPSGGSTAAGGDRGAFPSGRRPGLPVFPAHQGGCKGFIKTGAAGAHIHLPFTIHHLPFPHGRPPQPSEPSEPSEPFEPSRRKPRP
jgi:hypothetical protein